MIWAIVQLSTKETQFFCVMKVIDGGVLPEFPIEEFGAYQADIFYLILSCIDSDGVYCP